MEGATVLSVEMGGVNPEGCGGAGGGGGAVGGGGGPAVKSAIASCSSDVR